MPVPLNPYYKELKKHEYTSTSWKPEPYTEPAPEKEPEPQPLPNYYPKSYQAPHNPQIPYREVTTGKNPVEPYQHYFPKYTTTYYYAGYEDKKSIRIGYQEPYQKEEPKVEPPKEESYQKEEPAKVEPYQKEEPAKVEVEPYQKEPVKEESYKKVEPYKY